MFDTELQARSVCEQTIDVIRFIGTTKHNNYRITLVKKNTYDNALYSAYNVNWILLAHIKLCLHGRHSFATTVSYSP